MRIYSDERDIEYFRCDCHSAEHHFVLHFDREEREAHMEVFLSNSDSFWVRLKRAFKYLFCLPPYPYGHYEVVLLGPDTLTHLFNCIKRTI
jgi:hypothetical protein